jgi:hypothetical protein
MQMTSAVSHGICVPTCQPWNLLANGLARGWTPPASHSSVNWAHWKGGSPADRGFGAVTGCGTAILFDPFVDAALWAYRISNKQFNDTTVLVLTDFGPIGFVVSEAQCLLSSGHGLDYGEAASKEFFRLQNLGTTGNNIVKGVIGARPIEAIRREYGEDPLAVARAFAEKRVLLWNYFPFQRGSLSSCGLKGLPGRSNCRWFQLCDSLLDCFLRSVRARKILWCMNGAVMSARIACGCKRYGSVWSHPASWGWKGFPPI